MNIQYINIRDKNILDIIMLGINILYISIFDINIWDMDIFACHLGVTFQRVFWSLTFLRSHFSKFLYTQGGICQVFFSSRRTIVKFMSILSHLCLICVLWGY